MLLTDNNFETIRCYIYEHCGIHLTPVKKIMVQSRLLKLVQRAGCGGFDDYLYFAFNTDVRKNELVDLVDLITTNKTDFFREPLHFDFLQNDFLSKKYAKNKVTLKAWSAGCSTGAEAFTMALVLQEFKNNHAGFDFEILATDISTKVLRIAIKAIFTDKETNVIPFELKKRYLLRGKNSNTNLVRFIPEIRDKIKFSYLNLIDEEYGLNTKYDLIFCRNVLLYFDMDTKKEIINKLCNNLSKNGVLVLGQSESILSLDLPLKQIGPSIFTKL